MKKFLFLLFFPLVTLGQGLTYNKHIIKGIATISIPDCMETESPHIKEIKEIIMNMDYSSQKIVFIPKGDTEYARVIIWKLPVPDLTAEGMGQEEMKMIEEEFKALVKPAKIVRWTPIRKVKRGNDIALLLDYEREAVLKKDPNVLVKEYLFFHKGDMIRLTTSYQKPRRAYWKPIYDKIESSFSLIK